MSEFARLEEKLAKLRGRERAPGEGRKLRGSGADALLAAIITEIDETILPRRLTFTLESGSAIHLAVANRRLQALMAPAPEGVDAALAGQALPDAEAPAVAELADALKSVLADVGTVTITSTRLKTAYGSDIGVPAPQLSRAWMVSTVADAPPSDVLGAFLGTLKETDVHAWLRIEGEAVTDQFGPEKVVERLGEQAAIFLDGYFSKFETVFPVPSLACGAVISPGEAGAAALFFVEIGDLSAVISAKPNRVFAIASHWQSLVAE